MHEVVSEPLSGDSLDWNAAEIKLIHAESHAFTAMLEAAKTMFGGAPGYTPGVFSDAANAWYLVKSARARLSDARWRR